MMMMMMMMMMLSAAAAAAAAAADDDDDDDDDEDAINALRLRHCETFYRHFETRLLEPKWKKRWQIKTETERSSIWLNVAEGRRVHCLIIANSLSEDE